MFVVADNREGRILVSDRPDAPLRSFAQHLSVTSVAISADSQWIAAGALIHPRVQVWSAQDAKLALDLPSYSRVAFSADGQWFAAASTQHIRLYRTGSWQLERTLERTFDAVPSPVAFQPGGDLLAYAAGPGKVHLFDTRAGRVLATLTDPEPRRISHLTFSPDGTRLAFAGFGWDAGVWDLHELKHGLAELGLPTDGLPSRSEPLATVDDRFTVEWGKQLPPPDQWAKNWLILANWELLQGNLGDAIANASKGLQSLRRGASAREKAELLAVRGNLHELSHTLDAARSDWQAALELDPDRPQTAVRLARLCLIGPARFRDVRRALGLLAPLTPNEETRFLQAVADLRAGKAEPAKESLEPLVAESPLAGVYLAMAQQRAGDGELARETLRAAETAWQQHRTISPVEPREFEDAVQEARSLLKDN
jgi:tetratricopeptide (TPR) repeat protein